MRACDRGPLVKGRLVFRGFLPQSFSDYRGAIASVLYTGGCNLRCRYCYNRPLVLRPEALPALACDEAYALLAPRVGFIDAVVITGGEPTLHAGLHAFLSDLRRLPLRVGLDTNGSRPDVVAECLDAGLLDRVAVDYKASRARYAEVTGAPSIADEVLRTLACVAHQAPEYEVRLTLHPRLHTEDDIKSMAEDLAGAGVRRVALQTFRPWKVLDASLASGPVYAREDMMRLAGLFEGEVVVR